MPSTVELVLAVEDVAASEWMIAASGAAGRHGGARRQLKAPSRADVSVGGKGTSGKHVTSRVSTQADIGAAIAAALGRMPGVTETEAIESSTVQVLIGPHDGSRVDIWHDGTGTHRMTQVLTSSPLTPGVRQCETMCYAPGEAGAPSAVPPSTEDRSGKSVRSIPLAPLSVRRGAWRWIGSHGIAVDIELHDVHGRASDAPVGKQRPPAVRAEQRPAPRASSSAADRTTPSLAFCELRVSAQSPIAETVTSRKTASVTSRATDGTPPHAATASSAAVSAAERMQCTEDPSIAVLQALFAAADALAGLLPVFPALTDGYARAAVAGESEAPVRAGRIALSGAGTAHDALIDVGSSIARQWLGNEAGVRDRGDPECVHQMRVALRRLKTFRKMFLRGRDDTWEDTIAPGLEWLGTQLGSARDLDVFVETTLPALVKADLGEADWAPLEARAAARRDRARAQSQAALRTRRYAALTLAWLQWLVMQRLSPGRTARAGEPVTEYAAKRVRKHYKRLIGRPELISLTPAERHRRRIEVKHLRYTLEFFESLASRKTRRKVAKQLSRIQSVLGEGSDAATALRFLETLDISPYQHGFARGWCEAVNRWSAIEGERLLRDLGQPKIVRGNG